jgi:hypothetical protein
MAARAAQRTWHRPPSAAAAAAPLRRLPVVIISIVATLDGPGTPEAHNSSKQPSVPAAAGAPATAVPRPPPDPGRPRQPRRPLRPGLPVHQRGAAGLAAGDRRGRHRGGRDGGQRARHALPGQAGRALGHGVRDRRAGVGRRRAVAGARPVAGLPAARDEARRRRRRPDHRHPRPPPPRPRNPQEAAISSTRQRLAQGLEPRRTPSLHFVRGCHSDLQQYVGSSRARVVCFNLGYLPGQDKQLITQVGGTPAPRAGSQGPRTRARRS